MLTGVDSTQDQSPKYHQECFRSPHVPPDPHGPSNLCRSSARRNFVLSTTGEGPVYVLPLSPGLPGVTTLLVSSLLLPNMDRLRGLAPVDQYVTPPPGPTFGCDGPRRRARGQTVKRRGEDVVPDTRSTRPVVVPTDVGSPSRPTVDEHLRRPETDTPEPVQRVGETRR